jgi:hypothetical protein
MASDPRFGSDPNPYNPMTYQIEEPPRKGSMWKNCLIGCLAVMAVAVVLLVIVVYWVSQNLRGWFAGVGSQAVNQVIDSSDLPAQEKVEVKEQVERVSKSFAAGEISTEQAGAIVQKVMDSPLMPSLVVIGVEKKYFDRSKLSDEEKAQGRQVLKRFARGVFDGKINQKGIDSVMEHVAIREEDGNWHLQPNVSDDELRAALREAKLRDDEAHVEEAPADVDPSDEIKRIIDESLRVDVEEAPN